jgi:flagellar biosynthesis/type III secretory pathway protein FliH
LADAPPAAARRAIFPSFGTRSGASAPVGPGVAAQRERARREGLEAGREQGRSEAIASATPRLAAALSVLEQAATALDAQRAALASELEAALPRIVLALAERVLQREIAAEAPGAVAARAVTARLMQATRPVTVRVSAATAALLRDQLSGEPDSRAGVTIESDATLGPADWQLDSGIGLLDGRIATMLEEARLRMAEPEA